MPAITGYLRKIEPRLIALFIKQAKFHPLGNFREDGKISTGCHRKRHLEDSYFQAKLLPSLLLNELSNDRPEEKQMEGFVDAIKPSDDSFDNF